MTNTTVNTAVAGANIARTGQPISPNTTSIEAQLSRLEAELADRKAQDSVAAYVRERQAIGAELFAVGILLSEIPDEDIREGWRIASLAA